ncbi:MAG: hypothetical protein EOM91_20070 [Sphingobacteriia bacterium]|nr:hypothetical protein [Sphingobacteriia bacterium]
MTNELDAIAHEIGAVGLLIGSVDLGACAGVADVAPGLHAMMRRWALTIERVSSSVGGCETETEEVSVELTREEAALLRARAAAHGVSVEVELLGLVDGAIQRHRATGGRP